CGVRRRPSGRPATIVAMIGSAGTMDLVSRWHHDRSAMVPCGWYLTRPQHYRRARTIIVERASLERDGTNPKVPCSTLVPCPSSRASRSPIRARYHMPPKQPSRLRVITLANPKGGVGKTTICSALAVRAAGESRRVALLDLDPQESLASWWTRRGKTKNPKL